MQKLQRKSLKAAATLPGGDERKRKRTRRTMEERRLEDSIFGNTGTAGAYERDSVPRSGGLRGDVTGSVVDHEDVTGPLFFFDDQTSPSTQEIYLQSTENMQGKELQEDNLNVNNQSNGGAVWCDDEEEDSSTVAPIKLASNKRLRKLRNNADEKEISTSEYSNRLRNYYDATSSSQGSLSWVQRAKQLKCSKNVGSALEQDTEEEMPSSVENKETKNPQIDKVHASTALPFIETLNSENKTLSEGFLDIRRLRNANASSPSALSIRSVAFNPNKALTGNLMFATGLDKTLRLFDIDGDKNTKVCNMCMISVYSHCKIDFKTLANLYEILLK